MNTLRIPSRLLLLVCAASLVAVLFVPMWRIELNAPQYPEGLMLMIYANKLGGNVDIINGLNHYIGMKTLHEKDFMEFGILPVARYMVSRSKAIECSLAKYFSASVFDFVM